MDTKELVTLAVDNLKETCAKIAEMAADEKHLNQQSGPMTTALTQFANQLTLCFTIKNALNDVRKP